MTTTTTAPAQAGDYIRIRTSYPAGSPAQRQLVLAADATGLPLDGADEVAIVLCTSIEWRPAPDHGSGYWYVGWRNEQPALGAPRRVYNGTSGPRHVVGWDPRLGSFRGLPALRRPQRPAHPHPPGWRGAPRLGTPQPPGLPAGRPVWELRGRRSRRPARSATAGAAARPPFTRHHRHLTGGPT